MDEILLKIKEKTAKVLEALKMDLAGIRTGRANPSLIENVKVEVYGQLMTLKEVGMISAPDPKMLTVQPWDANNAQPILKGIRDSGLGLNPAEDSGVIRVPLPQITQERRNELIKLVSTKAEEKRVQIRNIRREVIDQIDKDKQSLRSGELKKATIGEDEVKRIKDQIQKAVDTVMAEVDSVSKTKEAELLEI